MDGTRRSPEAEPVTANQEGRPRSDEASRPTSVTISFQEYELVYVIAALRIMADRHSSGRRATGSDPDHGKRIAWIERSIKRQAESVGVCVVSERYGKVDDLYWKSRR